ncbi:uncharacterized protein LOC131633630 [Vicia villosa]|uniref:uncharacterized protein LOC131633630 n=1 Tax=Vicia villosa TaxID=3911 RepID=UPI00273CDB59|nr:uncharacterized protein LOC131633630 [Vicia villosa]
MQAFDRFSRAKGLKVNPAKCKIYYGGVDNDMKATIMQTTRINRWSSQLLSYALPFPKLMIHKIDVICRIFLWTDQKEKSKKSLIAWKTVCSLKKKGGLNLIDLQTWNNTVMAKLLWNLSGKVDNMHVKWFTPTI